MKVAKKQDDNPATIPRNRGQLAIQQNINPISQDGDILEKFAQMQNKSEIAEVLKELFKRDNIFMITDLSENQIALATRIYMIAEMKNIRAYKDGLSFFAMAKLSKQRKSRKEIIDAVSGYSKPANMMNPKNWFNGGQRP